MYNKSQETIDLDIQSVKWNHSGIREFCWQYDRHWAHFNSRRAAVLTTKPFARKYCSKQSSSYIYWSFVQMGNMSY